MGATIFRAIACKELMTGTIHTDSITKNAAASFLDFLSSVRFGGGSNTFQSGADLIMSISTGTKISTTATQLIAFHGATPIVQNAHIVDATDAATAITQINAVILALEAKGLLASS